MLINQSVKFFSSNFFTLQFFIEGPGPVAFLRFNLRIISTNSIIILNYSIKKVENAFWDKSLHRSLVYIRYVFGWKMYSRMLNTWEFLELGIPNFGSRAKYLFGYFMNFMFV